MSKRRLRLPTPASGKAPLSLRDVADRLAITEADVVAWLKISRGETKRYAPVQYQSLLHRVEMLRALEESGAGTPPVVNITVQQPIKGIKVSKK